MNELTGALPAHLMAAKPVEEKARQSMGKDDFMKLLLAQLQHQDPLNPMDHKDMSAQLAQFSSLEQLANIGSGIQNLKSGMGEDAKLQATGLIGRRVALSGHELELVDGQPASVALDRSTQYEPVKVTIFDGGGKLIRELPVTQRDTTSVAWDGKTDDGAEAPPGKYAFRMVGVDRNGQSQEMTGEATGKVVGVELIGKDAMLVIDGPAGRTKVELSKVKSIAVDEGGMAAPSTAPARPGVPGGNSAALAAMLQQQGGAAPLANSEVAAPDAPSNGPETELSAARERDFARSNWSNGMDRP